MRHLRNQIVLFFCLFTLINYSQDLISFHNSGNFQLIQKLSFYDINIKGTPFIFEDFVTGQIVFESGKNIVGDFRMDLYAHKIQTKNNDGKIKATCVSLNQISFGKNTINFPEKKGNNGDFLSIDEKVLTKHNSEIFNIGNDDLNLSIDSIYEKINSAYKILIGLAIISIVLY